MANSTWLFAEDFIPAEYARQGFFQLLVVCILNLGAVLVMEHFFQRSRAVDAVLAVIAEYLKDAPDI